MSNQEENPVVVGFVLAALAVWWVSLLIPGVGELAAAFNSIAH